MSDAKLTLWDKMLPDQPQNNEFFDREAGDYYPALYRAIADASGLRSPHEEFRLQQSDRFAVEEMGSNPISLRFLQMLIQLSGAKRVLEIGAFIGVSAMSMAKALPKGGKVVSLEKFDHFAEIARANFRENGLADRIDLRDGDAFELLPQLLKEEPFDLIFIDGNKERYADYFTALEPALRPGGLFVVDDVFFHGDAINQPPKTEKGEGVRAFLDLAATKTDYARIVIPISNGVMLLRKSAP